MTTASPEPTADPTAPSGAEVAALQLTLAAEHAAIFVDSALAGRASALAAPTLRTALATAYDVHVARRDHLRLALASAGATPVAADPAYRLPSGLSTAEQITRTALEVERRCATTYAALVAASSGPDRRWAVDALIATALAERGFGGAPTALPGVQSP